MLCVATQLSIGQKSLLYFAANQCSSGTSQMETRTVLKSTNSLAIVFPLKRLNSAHKFSKMIICETDVKPEKEDTIAKYHFCKNLITKVTISTGTSQASELSR